MLAILSNEIFTQEDYIQPGLLKFTATISPSSMLNRSVGNIYISGFAEYHLDKRLSIRGDAYWFVDGKSKSNGSNLFIGQGMRSYFGAFYHFNKKNWDKYIGVQPGIAMLKPLAEISPDAKLQVSPSFAIHIGSTYYIWKYFNFFVDIAYVNSTYRGLPNGSERTDEMILSTGLGFQVNTKRK